MLGNVMQGDMGVLAQETVRDHLEPVLGNVCNPSGMGSRDFNRRHGLPNHVQMVNGTDVPSRTMLASGAATEDEIRLPGCVLEDGSTKHLVVEGWHHLSGMNVAKYGKWGSIFWHKHAVFSKLAFLRSDIGTLGAAVVVDNLLAHAKVGQNSGDFLAILKENRSRVVIQ